MDLNLILKTLRKNKGLTLKEVANALEIKVSTYSNYEQGLREPPLKLIKKICKFYNVSSDFLLSINN